MLTATPATRLCCCCSYWYGPRSASSDGHVYVMEDAAGYCQLHEYYEHPPMDYCDDWVQWGIPGIVPVQQKILNCWEYHQCGYEQGGPNAVLHGTCPAWPAHGHSCAFVHTAKPAIVPPGTTRRLCANPAECPRCGFFTSGHHEKLIVEPQVTPASPIERRALFDDLLHAESEEQQ